MYNTDRLPNPSRITNKLVITVKLTCQHPSAFYGVFFFSEPSVDMILILSDSLLHRVPHSHCKSP